MTRMGTSEAELLLVPKCYSLEIKLLVVVVVVVVQTATVALLLTSTSADDMFKNEDDVLLDHLMIQPPQGTEWKLIVTKVMSNSPDGFQREMKIISQRLGAVGNFKYPG